MDYSYKQENNKLTLHLTTYLNTFHEIVLIKSDNEVFRIGGTAINSLQAVPAMLKSYQTFSFLRDASQTIHSGMLLDETLEINDHCWANEYYSLNMEEKGLEWLLSRKPLNNNRLLFINIDLIDGQNILIKRYRVCPYFGNYKIVEN